MLLAYLAAFLMLSLLLTALRVAAYRRRYPGQTPVPALARRAPRALGRRR
jgi:hypothetical protein